MYTAENQLVLNTVSDSDKRILDVGCGTGSNAKKIKARVPHCEIVGVNYDAEELEVASAHLDIGIQFDLNKGEPFTLDRKFDLIICSHILEHLIDPKTLISQLSNCLDDSGRMILVVPNFGFWSARIKVLRGNFAYEDHGLYDRTHLRFFTWFTFEKEVVPDGLNIRERYRRGHFPLPLLRGLLPKSIINAIDSFALKLWPNLFCSEIGLCVTK